MEEDAEETAAAQLTAAAAVERSKSPAPGTKSLSATPSTMTPSASPPPMLPTNAALATAAATLPPVSSFGTFHPAQYSPLLFMHPGLGMLTPSGQHFSIPFVPPHMPQPTPMHLAAQKPKDSHAIDMNSPTPAATQAV